MKKSVLFGLTASCALVLSACGGGNNDSTSDSDSAGGTGTPSGEQVINYVENSEMPSADLSLSTDVVSFIALNSVYEGIYRVNADQELEPAGAAEMAEVSEDGLTYKIKLNEKAKWTNGDPVTADDYVFGWQRTVDPATASQYAYLYESVANASEIMDDAKEPSELGIKAVSDYELEITLAHATPYFEYLLAFPTFFPQHQATVEEFGADYALTSENAIYNGPFTLADFDGPGTDTEWAYVKNDDYWDADTVKLDRVNITVVKEVATGLNLFQDGQVDDIKLSGELAQQMQDDPEFVSVKKGSTFYVEFNQREADSKFRNEDLRKAFSYSIDREAFVNNILANGSVAVSGLVPADLAFNEDGTDFVKDVSSKVEFDLDKAKEHWEKAKKELGVDTLEVEILADDTENGKKTTEYMQGALEDALEGLKVKVSNVPFSVRLDRSQKGDFDVVMSGWGADYADPSSFLDMFQIGNPYNRGGWENEEYDKLVKEAATTNANDPEKRWQNLVDAEDLIVGEVGVGPIYQKAEAHMRASKVKDIVAHASGVDFDFKWAYVEE